MNPHAARRSVRLAAIVCLSGIVPACSSGVQGTYTNPTGLAMLEVRSGGKATLTMFGQTRDCTSAVDGKKLNLECGGDRTSFRINDDGSLTGPGFMGVLKKSK
jgi:hypothetical protein